MLIWGPFRYRNDSFQSDIFFSDIGITEVGYHRNTKIDVDAHLCYSGRSLARGREINLPGWGTEYFFNNETGLLRYDWFMGDVGTKVIRQLR